MLPTITVGAFQLSMYYSLLFVAIMSVFVLGLRWNHGHGPKYPISLFIVLWAGIPGFIIGRISYFLFFMCPGRYDNFWDFYSGGQTFLGGFTGAVLGTLAYFERKDVPKVTAIDMFAVYVPVGAMVGRLGCFCYGCCYGKPTALPWGITFPRESPEWYWQLRQGLVDSMSAEALHAHPSQLYAVLAWALIFAVLLAARRRNYPAGSIIMLLCALYMAKRFLLDFSRADTPRLIWNLDLMQVLALPIIAICGLWLWRKAFADANGHR